MIDDTEFSELCCTIDIMNDLRVGKCYQKLFVSSGISPPAKSSKPIKKLQSLSTEQSCAPDPAGTCFESITPPIQPRPAGNSHQVSSSPSVSSPSNTKGIDDQQYQLCAAGSAPVANPGHSKINVIESLHDAIVDFCYDEPKTDTEIISTFQYKGFELPEIHKAMSELSKTKLHKYKESGCTMYSYKGVRADVDMDVGV